MIQTATLQNGPIHQGPRPDGSLGYRQARTVEQRAASVRYTDDAKIAAAIERLDGLLKSGTPVRDNVPPGYYLNIVT
ncbi:MAG: hypothetical protein H6905_09475 [Hyphomicrobiales bacterium]|nr:hypothetical protein [Hyphomicrobiales bacterium]